MNIKSFLTAAICAVATVTGTNAQSTDRVINIDTPVKMQVFLPAADKATGRAVVDLPGGGYTHLALQHEGCDWAEFFNSKGIALAVVTYSMPHGDRNIPVADAENAMKIMRANAKEWGINPNDVGIMGFSAGGHLASTTATHATGDAKPNFQILIYPVISMKKELTHEGSHNEFLGENPARELEEEYSGEMKVNTTTPPAYIALSGDDTCVNPMNSVLYYTALQKAGVPATLHIYATGEHGWGLRDSFRFHEVMLYDLATWLGSF